jgi:ATP-binding cassette subfamily B protein/ATP-binding cassette subfamily C protein
MKIPLGQYWALSASYLRPQWRRVVVMAVLLLSGIGLQLVSPLILRYFIDTASAHGSQAALTLAGALFIGSAVVQQVLGVGATYFSESVAWTSTNHLRRDLAAHCLELDMAFHNAHTPGELIERIDGDVTLLANFFSEFVIQVVGSALLVAGVLVMLFRLDWRIGLALFLFTALMLLVLNQLRGLATPHWITGRQGTADMIGFLEERLGGTEDIRSSRATDFVMAQFYAIMRRIMLSYRSAHVMGSVSLGLTRVGFTVGLAIGLGLGAYLYLHGAITIGTVFLTGYYAGILSFPLATITDQIDDFQQASAGMARIATLRDTPVRMARGGSETLPSGPPSIAFDHVSFGYRSDEPVLDDLTFSLPAGQVLGLLGRTGSGKTTVSRLLFRLYEPQRGAIRLAGTDIRDLDLTELRQRIGLVTQDVQLFHATVRENLTFFDERMPDARILEAVEALGLGSWYASLPDGLDTPLRGSSGLSAGEAQALAMTRVFLKDPDLVILDEASSRLDPATERLIEHAVDHLLAGRTAIVIAHRLRTVQRADMVMILSEHRALEFGRRLELMANRESRFARLLRSGLELETA